MPAFETYTQVYPRVSCFQTVFTAVCAGCDLSYLVKMCTLCSQSMFPFLLPAAANDVGNFVGPAIASPRCMAPHPGKGLRPLHSYVGSLLVTFLSTDGGLPSMSKSELSELQTANAEDISMITRKLVIKDSAMARCTAV